MIGGEARPPIRKSPRGMIFPGRDAEFFFAKKCMIFLPGQSWPSRSAVCDPNQQLAPSVPGGILNVYMRRPLPPPPSDRIVDQCESTESSQLAIACRCPLSTLGKRSSCSFHRGRRFALTDPHTDWQTSNLLLSPGICPIRRSGSRKSQ